MDPAAAERARRVRGLHPGRRRPGLTHHQDVENSAKGSARRLHSLARDKSSTPPAKSLLHWTAMKEGLLGGTLSVSSRSELEEAHSHVARWIGSESTSAGRLLSTTPAGWSRRPRRAPDADGLRHLVERVAGQRVRAVIESMNGARFVHDTLEELGWEVLVADAQKVKGLAPLACKTDKIDARVLADALVARPGAGDLAARPVDPPRARARALPVASGPPPHDAEEPHPRDADDLRASVPGLGPVRAGRPRAARPPGDPRSVAAQRRRQPRADRRPRAADRAA